VGEELLAVDVRAARRTFWLLCTSALGTFSAQGLLYPALPLYLTDSLGTTKAVAGLVVSAMSVAALVARPWSGWFVDRHGRRALLVGGPLLTVVSAVGLLTLRSVAAVAVLRLVQGVGSSMTYTAAGAVVVDVAPPDRRAGWLALYTVFFYVGFAIGPLVAEPLIDGVGFGAVWWAVIGFCGLGSLAALAVPETRSPSAPPPQPMTIVQRMFHPAAVGPGSVFFCIGVGWAAVASFLSLYAREIGLGGSETLFGVLSVTVLATRVFAGSLADRFGRTAVALPCVALTAVGLGMLALLRSPWPAHLALLLFGIGFSGGFPALYSWVVDQAPEEERGSAMSSFNVFYDIGGPIGGYGVGELIDRGGFGWGFGSVAVLAAVGLVILAVIGRPARAGAVVGEHALPPATASPRSN
jgi:MFS family permease